MSVWLWTYFADERYYAQSAVQVCYKICSFEKLMYIETDRITQFVYSNMK